MMLIISDIVNKDIFLGFFVFPKSPKHSQSEQGHSPPLPSDLGTMTMMPFVISSTKYSPNSFDTGLRDTIIGSWFAPLEDTKVNP